MAPISHKSQAALQLDDSYLLALAKQGSHDAYEQLVRRYYSFVRLKASSYFLIAARDAGCWSYGAAAGATVRYDTPDYSGGVVAVLGAEGRGLRPRVAAACDQLVSLPLRGRIDSLNVNAAGAVLLYEMLRQRLDTST